MNIELFGTKITEVNSRGNQGFILSDADMFYDIGFRVMQNQKAGFLLECHKLRYNGQIKFVYFTDGLISLEQVVKSGDLAHVDLVMKHLMKAVGEVLASGFLNVSCIDQRVNHIYVDIKDYSVRLIYLPINGESEVLSLMDFEKSVRSQMDSLKPDLASESVNEPENLLKDQGERSGIWSIVSKTNGTIIPISKSYFKVGKSLGKADACIGWNSAISRLHCEFAFSEDGRCFVRDMGSANGTYVNEVRITDNPFVEVGENSVIRLANEEFIVRR